MDTSHLVCFLLRLFLLLCIFSLKMKHLVLVYNSNLKTKILHTTQETFLDVIGGTFYSLVATLSSLVVIYILSCMCR